MSVMSTTCKLQLLPVHNDQEGVEAMLTVANVCMGVIVSVMSTTCKLQLLPSTMIKRELKQCLQWLRCV